MMVKRKDGIGTNMLHSTRNNMTVTQPEKYGKSSMQLSFLLVRWCFTMQSIDIAKTRIQLAKPKVAAFMVKIECKKYPRAV